MLALKTETSEVAELLRPPRRINVAEAAAESLYVNDSTVWNPDKTPYMIEPMNQTASKKHDVVCFVGPARTGKTLSMILGRYVYTVQCHPLDFAVIHSSQDLARDFSRRDLGRLHRYSPAMRVRASDRLSDDNTYDKTFRSGVIGVIGWPSNTQLASRTIPIMLLTDYDRWPGNIGGEGSGFSQARKRTQTAGRLAMTVVESSPGSHVADGFKLEPPVYELGKPLKHEFPASVSGVRANICAIYNAGDRRWWYVPCQACGEYYPQDPSIERFSWEGGDDITLVRESAGTVCPWCGTVHQENTKEVENANGVWLPEGQVIDCNGKISGEARPAFPSYAIGGGAAAYQKRPDIVTKIVQARAEAELTGDENNLKFVVNGDIGAPFLSAFRGQSRAINPIRQRAEAGVKFEISPEVRFIVAAVDCQKDRFVVQIVGYGPERNRWLIDRYNIRQAKTPDETGADRRVNPAAYAEDWLLLEPLLKKSYLIAGTGRKMQVAALVVDAGGSNLKGGSNTANAYEFGRHMIASGYGARFRLVRGASSPEAPLVQQTWPDAKRRAGKKHLSRGEVPQLYINTQRMKNRIDADLKRDRNGVGFIHFPQWLGEWFYKELAAETRNEKGLWHNPGNQRNEAFDLLVYAEAAAVWGLPFYHNRNKELRGIEAIDWNNPPQWASDSEKNPFILGADEKTPEPTPEENPAEFKRAPRFRRKSGGFAQRWR